MHKFAIYHDFAISPLSTTKKFPTHTHTHSSPLRKIMDEGLPSQDTTQTMAAAPEEQLKDFPAEERAPSQASAQSDAAAPESPTETNTAQVCQ